MSPCPYCKIKPSTVLITPVIGDMLTANLMIDAFLCPSCRKVVGVAQANGAVNVWWLWDKLVEIAPFDRPFAQPMNKPAERREVHMADTLGALSTIYMDRVHAGTMPVDEARSEQYHPDNCGGSCCTACPHSEGCMVGGQFHCHLCHRMLTKEVVK